MMLKAMLLNFGLAWSQTLNLWRAGALRVLVFALVLAVVAITAVGFFTKRVESALSQQGAYCGRCPGNRNRDSFGD